ncbi:lactonase family protein [Flavobacterium caeni]|uniref:6-phosphogluconolactonase n=1 Tax=Flavobacterium caeni TaxID=490189 RepID=A0A1G5IVS4_9FLAO|nr:lactonase family protein [Flavobacterium caeni]SCY80182.1 6-phosphogluconolactonase [Flavobacterium caeni]
MKKILISLAVVLVSATGIAQKKYPLLIGTYTNSCESAGIYAYEFDAETGAFLFKSSSKNVQNPSYLTVSPDGKTIYSVNENGANSQVSSFDWNAATGKIDFRNAKPAMGADPCHIINDEKNVIAANYSGGNIAVFGKQSGGSLTDAKQVIQHEGHSVNAQRQESPHVHMVHFSPDKKFVLANDLGTDRLYVYDYAADANSPLRLKDTVPTKTGGGPRHLAFSPNGLHVYLLHELDGALTVFNYKNGTLRRIQETSVVPAGFSGSTSAADLHLSADGKFLYATNRGDANTISVFSVDARGKLAHQQTLPSGGKGPRNFAIDPTGKYVLVAHQYSNDIIVFERDQATGLLKNTGKKLELCAPVCLVFAP